MHLGGDVVVRTKEVVAIIDINHLDKRAKKNFTFLEHAKIKYHIENIVNEDVKSCVITTDKIYYSPISSLTLKKRAASDIKNFFG